MQNITIARALHVHMPQGAVGGYVHNFGSYGALVSATYENNEAAAANAALPGEVQKLCNQLAQHVVAMDPTGENMEDAIAALKKQPFVLDGSMTVNKLVKKTGERLRSKIAVKELVRWGAGRA